MFSERVLARSTAPAPSRGVRAQARAGADGADVLYIYDEIGFFGVTAKDVVRALSTCTADALEVHVNSPGGDVFDGIAIYNAIKEHGARVTTICDGIAASAASFIFQAGERRVMTRNAMLMIHDAWGMCVGPADDMRKFADMLDKASDNIADIYAQASGKRDADHFRAQMREEAWLNADEAIEAGLATDIQGEAQASNAWDVRFFNRRTELDSATTPDVVKESTDQDEGIDLDGIINALKEAWS